MKRQIVHGYAGTMALRGGFTLAEVVVVLGVGSLLISITIPAMTDMLNAQKANATASALFTSLNLARVEAIKRNARAVLCKTADGVSCTTVGGWEQGWILFHDANNNAVLDAGEVVLQQQGPASRGTRLTGNAPVANYVSYSPSGSAKLISGAFQAGTFTLCLASASNLVVIFLPGGVVWPNWY